MYNKNKINNQYHLEPQAKNPEKIILDNRIVRFAPASLGMTMLPLTLSLFLFLSLSLNLSTAWAELVGTWTCGTSCTATLDDEGNFLVTGSGPMTDYDAIIDSEGKPVITTAPWADYLTQIRTLEIEGVTNVGKDAFYNNRAKISNVSVKIGDTIEEIGAGAFHKIGMSDLEMSDSIKKIESFAFAENQLSQITLPDTIETLAKSALGRGETNNLTIICRGNNCSHLEKLLENYKYSTTVDGVSVYISSDLSALMAPADASTCDSTNYYWNGTGCHNKKNGIICSENYKWDGNFCLRVRYTPAEAAEAAGESNTIFLYYK